MFPINASTRPITLTLAFLFFLLFIYFFPLLILRFFFSLERLFKKSLILDGTMDVLGLRSELSKHKQEHLLQFWDQLTENQRNILFEDLKSIDLAEVNANFRKVSASEDSEADAAADLDELLEPVPSDCFGSFSRTDEATLREYEDVGLRATARGRVGVLLLAGGQGTRLGVSYPKGMYDVGLPSKKTLYQLQAERILKLEELAASRFASDAAECRRLRKRRESANSGGGGAKTAANSAAADGGLVPWYIMTSEATRDQTIDFFESHDFFGLQRRDVVVFEQNLIPCLSLKGEVNGISVQI